MKLIRIIKSKRIIRQIKVNKMALLLQMIRKIVQSQIVLTKTQQNPVILIRQIQIRQRMQIKLMIITKTTTTQVIM